MLANPETVTSSIKRFENLRGCYGLRDLLPTDPVEHDGQGHG
jgi:hypothetical protein